MGKKWSRIIALLILLATTFMGALSTYAAAPDTGNLHIHKYWVDKENPHPTGKENNGTEQLDIANPPVSGVGFDVYKIGSLELVGTNPATDEEKEAHAVPNGGAGWTYKKTSDKLVVSNGTTPYTYSLGANLNSSSMVTNVSGELTFPDLAKGYYYVEENLGSGTPQVNGENVEIASKVKPFVVSVPMTAPDGINWLTDVHVYPKNEGLNPEKTSEMPSVNVGDEVKWSITADIPTDFNDYTAFSLTDNLDEKLNFVTGSVEVYGTEADGKTKALDGLTAPDDYQVTHTPADPSNAEKVVVALTEDGIDKFADNEDVVKIRIDLGTTVNSKINEVENNTVENKAEINYQNTTTSDGKINTSAAGINTGKVSIKKTDQDGANLATAKFKLYYVEGSDKYDLYKNDTGAIKGVKVGENAPAGYSLYEVVSGADGVALFSGLKTHKSFDDNGDPKDPITYYIEETKAPDGYNLLQDPVQVSFADADDNHVVAKGIVNKKGFTLPNTGGIGMILLVVIGIVFIGLAIILTMSKKKKTA